MVERVTACCRASALPAWWVGGTVRDSLLGAAPRRPELDLTVERDPAALVACLQGQGARLRRRSQFATLALELPQGIAIDVAKTRRERYARPGALPIVEPASLQEDLARRDFSINAMALPVGGGDLVDPMNGRVDLAGARLRVLHGRSFEDDPTRILRGSRFEARWGFRFDAETEAAARRAVAADGLWTVGPDRLRREIERCGAEPRLLSIVARWVELGVWRSVFGACAAPHARLARWDERLERLPLSNLGIWVLLLSGSSEPEALAVARRLRLPPRQLEAIAMVVRWAERWESEKETARDSSAVDSWAGLDPEVRRLLISSSAHGDDWAGPLEEAATVELTIGGADLIGVGVPPGPGLGQALRATLAARRRGEIDANQEFEFACRWARRSIDD